MNQIKVKTPAKINLTLEILRKMPNGFHEIQSIMQAIDLFDFLTIQLEENDNLEIKLKGNSNEIPYDEKNIVHKAIVKFLENLENKNYKIYVYIEKNIPVAAGLAGGSTNAAGVIYGLNKLLDNVLSKEELHKICAELGSDLNFCLEGGCQLTTSRGEILQPLKTPELNISLIKPKNLGISAGFAYSKYSEMKNKTLNNNTLKLVNLIKKGEFDKKLLTNHLEEAMVLEHEEIKFLNKSLKDIGLMSGSGSTFFCLSDKINIPNLSDDYLVFNGHKTINYGVCEA